MAFTNRISSFYGYIFGFLASIILFYLGASRISTGITSVRITEPVIAHFMNTGLLYIQISLLFFIGLTVVIIWSFVKYKK